MKRMVSILIMNLVLISCEKNNQITSVSNINVSNEKNIKDDKSDLDTDVCMTEDTLALKTSEYEGVTFFSENKMRGSGVVHLSINKKIEILNIDKTVYGSINPNSENEFSGYEIKFPKRVIAREVMPDSELQIFDFDSESPAKDSTYLIIYINKEKKLIAKKDLKYNFLSWQEYIKSAFLQLTSDIQNVNENERKYWYKVIKIKNDSMLIRSISKTDCEYVENYKDVSKWIKWKNNNCKLIKFSFCY